MDEERLPRVGDLIRVVKGRKVPIGLEGRVVWVSDGMGAWGPRYRANESIVRIGFMPTGMDGEGVPPLYTAASNVMILGKAPVPAPGAPSPYQQKTIAWLERLAQPKTFTCACAECDERTAVMGEGAAIEFVNRHGGHRTQIDWDRTAKPMGQSLIETILRTERLGFEALTEAMHRAETLRCDDCGRTDGTHDPNVEH